MRLSAATIGELLYHNADDREARAALIEAVQDPYYVRCFEYNPVDGVHTLVTGRRSEGSRHPRWCCCTACAPPVD